MLKIGFDIDNTLIDYAPSIRLAASHVFGLDLPLALSKSQAVAMITNQFGIDAWTQLQGYVYAEYALFATPFANAICVLKTAKKLGWEVHLVSHKSTFPASNRQVNLKAYAIRMIEVTGIAKAIDPAGQLPWETIHLCETLEEKISTINALGFDIFVDDLTEVLIGLESKISKIHIFCDATHDSNLGLQCASNWNEVKALILQFK